MFNFKKLFIIIVSFILFQNCNRKDESKNQYSKTHTIKYIGDKIISLDSLIDPWQANYFFYDSDSVNKLFLLSTIDNSLQIYDWKTGKMESKKVLPKQGPNGVGNAGSLMVKNLDSIFVLSGFQFKLYQLDRNFNLVKSYSLLDPIQKKESLGQGMFATSNHACAMGYWKNNIYIGGYPFIDRKEEKFYLYGNTSLKLDLTSGELKYLTKSPPSYSKRFNTGYIIAPQQTVPSLTFNYDKRQMIISYMTDFNIEVFDMEKKESQYYFIGSDEVDELKWANKNLTGRDLSKYFIKQPGFSGIYYDSYRNIYYRIFEKPNPNKVDGYDKQPWTIPSVIIIDDKFKKIGEIEIHKVYSLTTIIIAKEGLYLRKYVEDEDKMVFSLFKPIKL